MDAILKLLNAARLFAIPLIAIFAFCFAAPPAHADNRVLEAGDVRFEALAPQNLPDGTCGLFLWAKQEEPMFLLMAFDSPAEARVNIDGRERRLRRTDHSGPASFGHFESQTFSDGRLTFSVSLHIDPDRPLQGGAIIDSGALRLTNAEGWETVSPVGGMIACQR